MAFVSFQNVSKVYKTGEVTIEALHDVNFEIEKVLTDEDYCLVIAGAGAGKTTILNILGGMDYLTTGKVYLDGEEVSAYNKRQLTSYRRYDVGFVFQFYNLVQNLTALENVELPMIYKGIPEEERKVRAKEVLKIVGLEKREDHMPNQMSGGQQQRVAIARAIVNNPPLILADEPTGNLDTKTSIEVMEFFVNLNKSMKKTIVLVTHEPDIAQYCKRVVKFKDGNIISDELNTHTTIPY